MNDSPDHKVQKLNEEAPPSWLAHVVDTIKAEVRKEMKAEILQLHQRLDALNIQDPRERSYPTEPTPQAWENLLRDPAFGPEFTPLIDAIGAASTIPTIDENVVSKINAAYAHLVSIRRASTDATTRPHQQPRLPCSASSSSRGPTGRGLIEFEGRTLYVSQSGNIFDPEKDPPKPCRNCPGQYHWAFKCPKSTYSAYAASSSAQSRNSIGGGGYAAPSAPHH